MHILSLVDSVSKIQSSRSNPAKTKEAQLSPLTGFSLTLMDPEFRSRGWERRASSWDEALRNKSKMATIPPS